MGRAVPVSVSTPAFGAARPIAGIIVLVLSSWALSGLDASGKWVMGAGVPLLVLCWVRYVVHLLLVRSEEHTSELQSLMRISYAVFCLKKKQKRQTTSRKRNTATT